jgi:hypothetical protein
LATHRQELKAYVMQGLCSWPVHSIGQLGKYAMAVLEEQAQQNDWPSGPEYSKLHRQGGVANNQPGANTYGLPIDAVCKRGAYLMAC